MLQTGKWMFDNFKYLYYKTESLLINCTCIVDKWLLIIYLWIYNVITRVFLEHMCHLLKQADKENDRQTCREMDRQSMDKWLCVSQLTQELKCNM